MRSGVYETARVRPSVCLSVCLSQHGHTTANELLQGLLLWARRAGDIERLVQQRRAAGECGQWHVVSVRTVGSWTQSCLI